jgi:hypothetical protein
VLTLDMSSVNNTATDAKVVLGPGVSLTTVNKVGGDLTFNSAATTVEHKNGMIRKLGAGAITTLENRNGTAVIGGSGAVTTINQRSGNLKLETSGITTTLNNYGGMTDTATVNTARTITTTNFYPGSSMTANMDAVTFTNNIDPSAPSRVEITFALL